MFEKHSFIQSSYPKRSSTLHTQTPSCAFTPALPSSPVILSSGVSHPVFTISPLCLHTLDVDVLALESQACFSTTVSHRLIYPRFITESVLEQRKRLTSLGCTLTEDLKRESKGYNFPLRDFVAFFQSGLFD